MVQEGHAMDTNERPTQPPMTAEQLDHFYQLVLIGDDRPLPRDLEAPNTPPPADREEMLSKLSMRVLHRRPARPDEGL
ncbi:MAG: hypothetical protein IT229_08515 [Flavobacteriales bacterium]|nr:hypothetical protein [Flavobacteriales bacterium]